MEKPSKTYIFANWKMYLSPLESQALATELKTKLQASAGACLAVFPSALALPEVEQVLRGSATSVGAQNVYPAPKGGYTGEVSAAMFAEVGCRYALVGHSERRKVFHETNEEVREKLAAVLAAGMTPVLCVGETAAERDAGQTKTVVEAQLRSALVQLSWPASIDLIIAYEPIWAISRNGGSGCDPAEAEKMANMMSGLAMELIPGILPAVLYGASVEPHNVAAYLAQPHVCGVLVGAASTTFVRWQDIITNAF